MYYAGSVFLARCLASLEGMDRSPRRSALHRRRATSDGLFTRELHVSQTSRSSVGDAAPTYKVRPALVCLPNPSQTATAGTEARVGRRYIADGRGQRACSRVSYMCPNHPGRPSGTRPRPTRSRVCADGAASSSVIASRVADLARQGDAEVVLVGRHSAVDDPVGADVEAGADEIGVQRHIGPGRAQRKAVWMCVAPWARR